MSKADEVNSGTDITADVSEESLQETNVRQFSKLHQNLLQKVDQFHQADGTLEEMQARSQLQSALLTEVMTFESALRETKYWADVELGEIEYVDPNGRSRLYVFEGLSSLIENRTGVTLRMQVREETPGRKQPRHVTDTRTVEIPEDVLVRGFRALQMWLDDVGLTMQMEDGEQRTKITDDLLEEVKEWREQHNLND